MDNDIVGTIDGHSITLRGGGVFDLLDPDPDLITPDLLADSLSKLCRFTGHTKQFYSVAQHCVHVSRLIEPHLALDGLLHDASEAFIGDISRPLKVVMESHAPGVLREIEERIHLAVARRFGTGWPHDSRVKVADNIAVATEGRDLMENPDRWRYLPDPDPNAIWPLMPTEAAWQWTARFKELTSGG